MKFFEEYKTVIVIFVVGFIVWLLFHFATKQTAAAATAASTVPTAPASLSYP